MRRQSVPGYNIMISSLEARLLLTMPRSLSHYALLAAAIAASDVLSYAFFKAFFINT